MYLSLPMLAVNLHIVICHFYVELLRGEVLHIQVNHEPVPVRPHLGKNKKYAMG